MAQEIVNPLTRRPIDRPMKDNFVRNTQEEMMQDMINDDLSDPSPPATTGKTDESRSSHPASKKHS